LWSPSAAYLHQQPDDVVLNPGPLYHNAPFLFTSSALFAGAHIIEMGKFDAERALSLIEQYRVQWVNLVPTMMHRIWALPEAVRNRYDLSSLRVVMHMASACPVWLKENWIHWLGPERVWEMYGGTEGLGATELNGVDWLTHKGSVGKPYPGCRVRVLKDGGEDCAIGEVGEIYFLPDSGSNSTYHYIGAEARAQGDWQSIGDLGYLDADGFLYLVDRRTDLIISGGANVYPAEVEGALDAHPDVRSSIAIGLPDNDLGQRVHALVELSPDAAGRIVDTDLRAFLADRIARYKIPRTFEFVSEPLRDDAGKARRSALREARVKS
jgi:bile acid-coenzyme A ligase